jgi:hypothetical protein
MESSKEHGPNYEPGDFTGIPGLTDRAGNRLYEFTRAQAGEMKVESVQREVIVFVKTTEIRPSGFLRRPRKFSVTTRAKVKATFVPRITWHEQYEFSPMGRGRLLVPCTISWERVSEEGIHYAHLDRFTKRHTFTVDGFVPITWRQALALGWDSRYAGENAKQARKMEVFWAIQEDLDELAKYPHFPADPPKGDAE